MDGNTLLDLGGVGDKALLRECFGDVVTRTPLLYTPNISPPPNIARSTKT